MDTTPAAEFLDLLRGKVESGEFPSEAAAWKEAIRRFQRSEEEPPETDVGAVLNDAIDHDAIDYCARQIQGQDVPSLEEVRRILASIPGSLSRAVEEEREGRF